MGLRIKYALDHFWCDKYGMFFQGWILCPDSPIRRFIITVGEDRQEVTHFAPRPDLLQFYPGQPDVARAGFAEFVPSRPGEKVFFTVETDTGSQTIPIQLPKLSLPELPTGREGVPEAFLAFVDEVNERHLTVLEIGSRIVGDESKDCRQFFPHAGRYIGLDIHDSPTVDVIGDAHFLSEIVGVSSIDAVFSLSVIEHLRYPWLLAREINRALTIGGLIFHSTPQAWPLHEQPNDFWRFSDEGLKVLFGPDMGFEIIHASMINPVYMYPEERRGGYALLPLNPGFGHAMILSRKIRDIDPNSIAWPVQKSSSQERAERYPLIEGKNKPEKSDEVRPPRGDSWRFLRSFLKPRFLPTRRKSQHKTFSV